MKNVFFFETGDFQKILAAAVGLNLNWNDYKESFSVVPQLDLAGNTHKLDKHDVPFEHLVSFHRFTWLRHSLMNSLVNTDSDSILPEDALRTIRLWLERHCTPSYPEWEPYSVSERLISWLWCLMWLRSLNSISFAERGLMESAIKSHASYLENNLEYRGVSTNNHILKDAQGLMYAGCYFYEDKNAQRWRDAAKGIFFSELERQFSYNYVHLEQSSHYHFLCAKRYIECYLLAEKAGIDWGQDLWAPINQMLQVAYTLALPDSSIPLFSDVSPDESPSLTSKTVLNLGGYLLGNGEYLQKAGGVNLEALWLMGIRALDINVDKSDIHAETNYFTIFPESFISSDGDHLCWRMDCGPIGFKYAPGHGHNDMLSLQVWNNGCLWIGDSGTYTYDDRKIRQSFKSTYAHSTVIVDRKEQVAERSKIRKLLSGPLTSKAYPIWSKTSETSTAVLCEHTGYTRVGVRHRRLIISSRSPEYMVVLDYIQGKGRHVVEQLFQIGNTQVQPTQSGTGVELRIDARVFSIMPFANMAIFPKFTKGFCSPFYGKKEESHIVNYEYGANLPLICGVVLSPGGIQNMEVRSSFKENHSLSLELEAHGFSKFTDYIGIHLTGETPPIDPFEGSFEIAIISTQTDGELLLVADGDCRIQNDFLNGRKIVGTTKFTEYRYN